MPLPTAIFDNGFHQLYHFSDLVEGEGVQANQYLIVRGDQAALLEPGGSLTAKTLLHRLKTEFRASKLSFIFASHQDPDVISSVYDWLTATQCRLVISRVWSRFLPHLLSEPKTTSLFDRLVAVPDEGMNVPFAGSSLVCLPAHFMHSPGNLSFYDPVSRTLFSGDIGSSLSGDATPVEDFASHRGALEPFHRRYMASNQVCRWWVNMVRGLDVAMILPQHGRPMCGPLVINDFLTWLEKLPCGIDLLDQEVFQRPSD